jgi:hypothetical protein
MIKAAGCIDDAYRQPYAYPVAWKDAPSLYDPTRREDIVQTVAAHSAPFVHLWNSVLIRAGFQQSIRPPEDSYLDRAARDLKLDWPRPDAQYTAEAVAQMRKNYRAVQQARLRQAKLNAIKESRSWQIVSYLRELLGWDPIG